MENDIPEDVKAGDYRCAVPLAKLLGNEQDAVSITTTVVAPEADCININDIFWALSEGRFVEPVRLMVAKYGTKMITDITSHGLKIVDHPALNDLLKIYHAFGRLCGTPLMLKSEGYNTSVVDPFLYQVVKDEFTLAIRTYRAIVEKRGRSGMQAHFWAGFLRTVGVVDADGTFARNLAIYTHVIPTTLHNHGHDWEASDTGMSVRALYKQHARIYHDYSKMLTQDVGKLMSDSSTSSAKLASDLLRLHLLVVATNETKVDGYPDDEKLERKWKKYVEKYAKVWTEVRGNDSAHLMCTGRERNDAYAIMDRLHKTPMLLSTEAIAAKVFTDCSGTGCPWTAAVHTSATSGETPRPAVDDQPGDIVCFGPPRRSPPAPHCGQGGASPMVSPEFSDNRANSSTGLQASGEMIGRSSRRVTQEEAERVFLDHVTTVTGKTLEELRQLGALIKKSDPRNSAPWSGCEISWVTPDSKTVQRFLTDKDNWFLSDYKMGTCASKKTDMVRYYALLVKVIREDGKLVVREKKGRRLIYSVDAKRPHYITIEKRIELFIERVQLRRSKHVTKSPHQKNRLNKLSKLANGTGRCEKSPPTPDQQNQAGAGNSRKRSRGKTITKNQHRSRPPNGHERSKRRRRRKLSPCDTKLLFSGDPRAKVCGVSYCLNMAPDGCGNSECNLHDRSDVSVCREHEQVCQAPLATPECMKQCCAYCSVYTSTGITMCSNCFDAASTIGPRNIRPKEEANPTEATRIREAAGDEETTATCPNESCTYHGKSPLSAYVIGECDLRKCTECRQTKTCLACSVCRHSSYYCSAECAQIHEDTISELTSDDEDEDREGALSPFVNAVSERHLPLPQSMAATNIGVKSPVMTLAQFAEVRGGDLGVDVEGDADFLLDYYLPEPLEPPSGSS